MDAREGSLEGGPVARTVEYVAELRLLMVGLSDGRRLALPVEELPGLIGATAEQMGRFVLVEGGAGIRFPWLEVELYVPALIEGVYGTRRWMAVLGRMGGAVKTEAKREAARKNGVKGGRPRKDVYRMQF